MPDQSGLAGAIFTDETEDGSARNVQSDIVECRRAIVATGKPPFFRGDIPHQVRTIDPPTIEERLDEFGLKNPIPADVSAMIMACLSKEPENRPQSVRAVASWIGFAEDAPPLEETLGDVFAGQADIDISPSSNELTVLPPEEPTEVEPPSADPPLPTSKPRMTEAELPYIPDSEPTPAAASKRGLWKKIGIVAVCMLVLLILASINKKGKARQHGKEPRPTAKQKALGKLADPNRPAKSPWIGGKPIQEPGPFKGIYRPYRNGTLENCTVITLNELPGEEGVRRSIRPWREDNPYWSIDESVITCDLKNDHEGSRKTYLVFNSLDLENFMVAFTYKGDDISEVDGNYGVFYRCRSLGDPDLGDWYMDGIGVILGDNSGALFGLPQAAFKSQERTLSNDFKSRPFRDFMGQAKRSRLMRENGNSCTIRTDGRNVSHIVNSRYGHQYQIAENAGKPESGTIAAEVWLKGQGELSVSFEGFFTGEPRMGKMRKKL
ncbi:MAG: hypothetical protein ACPGVU_15000 [Limisphaerales bacterium]